MSVLHDEGHWGLAVGEVLDDHMDCRLPEAVAQKAVERLMLYPGVLKMSSVFVPLRAWWFEWAPGQGDSSSTPIPGDPGGHGELDPGSDHQMNAGWVVL